MCVRVSVPVSMPSVELARSLTLTSLHLPPLPPLAPACHPPPPAPCSPPPLLLLRFQEAVRDCERALNLQKDNAQTKQKLERAQQVPVCARVRTTMCVHAGMFVRACVRACVFMGGSNRQDGGQKEMEGGSDGGAKDVAL